MMNCEALAFVAAQLLAAKCSSEIQMLRKCTGSERDPLLLFLSFVISVIRLNPLIFLCRIKKERKRKYEIRD